MSKEGATYSFNSACKRYERGSIIITTDKAYKHRPAIFTNDASFTSAILDRLLHRAQTVDLEGKSFMKDRIVEEPAV